MAKVDVTAYRYYKSGSQQPYFVYIEDGYDKDVLPCSIQNIVKDPYRTKIDINGNFGPSGLNFFSKYHYVNAEITSKEHEGRGGDYEIN